MTTDAEAIERQRAQWRAAAAKSRGKRRQARKRSKSRDPMALAGWRLNHLGFWEPRKSSQS